MPRYDFQWIDRRSKMTILDRAEAVAGTYEEALYKDSSMPTGISNVTFNRKKQPSLKMFSNANKIVELLYLKGWSHASKCDRTKNHNQLLIYALQNVENCYETLLDYMNENIMVRYKPDFNNEGDKNRNFLYNLEDHQFIRVPCILGMKKIIYKDETGHKIYYIFESFEPFKLKPIFQGAESKQALRAQKYSINPNNIQIKFLKLDANQPGMCYAPDYYMRGNNETESFTALDVVNFKIATLGGKNAPNAAIQKQKYEVIRSKLIQRGWTDWETAVDRANGGLIEVAEKLQTYEKLVNTENILNNSAKMAKLQKMIEAAKRRKLRIEIAKSELIKLTGKSKCAYCVKSILLRHALLNKLKL